MSGRNTGGDNQPTYVQFGPGVTPPASEERADCESWVEAGTLVEADFGCEGACAIIPLYSRIAR